MAVTYINEEFAKIRDEEKSKRKSTPNSTPSTPNSTSNDAASLQEQILELIKNDKHITKKAMVKQLGVTMYALKRELADMRDKHIVEYVGYSRKGEWVVYDENAVDGANRTPSDKKQAIKTSDKNKR